jgi:hypothetical protein
MTDATALATCTKCDQVKPLTAFAKDKRRKTGFSTRCIDCVRSYSRAWYEQNDLAKNDTGELTLDCGNCGKTFTYVKTTGPRRRFCTRRCALAANYAVHKSGDDRPVNSKRRCVCGSDKVARVGKPVCTDCRKDKRVTDREHEVRRRLRLYNLTVERYDAILASQSGRCAICATDDPGPRGWHIDHDHGCCPGIGSCGQCVRGLLCHYCNMLLGHAKDSTDVLDRAKQYLLDTSQYSMPT